MELCRGLHGPDAGLLKDTHLMHILQQRNALSVSSSHHHVAGSMLYTTEQKIYFEAPLPQSIKILMICMPLDGLGGHPRLLLCDSSVQDSSFYLPWPQIHVVSDAMPMQGPRICGR